jgi:CRP/FNR family transcriptional regulator, cyclic AMP receptor protein
MAVTTAEAQRRKHHFSAQKPGKYRLIYRGDKSYLRSRGPTESLAIMQRHISFRKGDFLFHQGDASDRVFLIEAGKIEILREVNLDSILLGEVEAGEWLGEMGVMETRRRSATARAASHGTAEVLTSEEFIDRVSRNPEIARDLLLRLSIRLRRIEDKVAGTLSNSVSEDAAPDYKIPLGVAVSLAANNEPLRSRIGAAAIQLTHLPYIVGRIPEKDEQEALRHPDLLLPDHEPFRLSRDHFMIVQQDDRLLVWDLGSTLGTIVNGKAIGHHFMNDSALLHRGRNRILAGGWDSPFDFTVAVDDQNSALSSAGTVADAKA